MAYMPTFDASAALRSTTVTVTVRLPKCWRVRMAIARCILTSACWIVSRLACVQCVPDVRKTRCVDCMAMYSQN